VSCRNGPGNKFAPVAEQNSAPPGRRTSSPPVEEYRRDGASAKTDGAGSTPDTKPQQRKEENLLQKFTFALFATMAVLTTGYADETVRWYVDDTLYDTTTCTLGGDIVLPTPPTKVGRVFHGWAAFYDFSSIDTSINGHRYYARTLAGTCRYLDADAGMTSSAVQTCSNANYSDLVTQEWKTIFDYGTVYGTSLCSVTGGTYAVAGTPDEVTTGDEALKCWCKLEGIKPTGSEILYEPPAASLWVFDGSASSRSVCESDCAYNCGIQRPWQRRYAQGLVRLCA